MSAFPRRSRFAASFVRRAARALALGGIALVSPHCRATDFAAVYSNGVTYVTLEELNSSFARAGAGARFERPSVQLPGPGGAQVAARVGTSLSLRGAAMGAAYAVGRLAPTIALGIAAYQVYQVIGVSRPSPSAAAGELRADEGQPERTDPHYRYRVSCYGQPNEGDCSFLTSEAAAVARGVPPPATSGGWSGANYVTCTATWGGGSVGSWSTYEAVVTYSASGGVFNFNTQSCVSPSPATRPIYRSQFSGQPWCPDFVDGFTGLARTGEKLPNGQCRSGSYTVAMTPQEAADAVLATQSAQRTLEQWGNIVAEALGHSPIPKVVLSGDLDVGNVVPSTLPGPSSTTTTPGPNGGSVVQTTATNFSPSWKGNWLAWERQTTVSTQTLDAQGVPVGAPTVVSTTKATPQPSQGSDPVDPCSVNPDRIGCSEYGDVPGSELPRENLNFVISAFGGFGGYDVACPAPRQINLALLGRAIDWEWTLWCQWADMLRPLVLAFALLGSTLIAVRIGSGGD